MRARREARERIEREAVRKTELLKAPALTALTALTARDGRVSIALDYPVARHEGGTLEAVLK